VAETRRLASKLTATGIAVNGVVRNRVARTLEAPSLGMTPVFLAPEADPAPIGVAAIHDWCERWSLQD
jgi:hypothetical protein